MVLSEMNPRTDQARSYRYSTPECIWWEDVQAVSNVFLQVVQSPELMLKSHSLSILIEELQAAHDFVSKRRTPTRLRHLKTCLLASIADLLKGYREYLAKGDAIALAYLKSAQFEMQFVKAELKDLRKNSLIP